MTNKVGIARTGKFTVIVDHVVRDPRLSKNEVLVYLALCMHADKSERVCFPGLRTLARAAKLSLSSTQTAIKVLVATGIVKRKAGRKAGEKAWSPTIYTLCEGAPRAGTGCTEGRYRGVPQGKGRGVPASSTDHIHEETEEPAGPEDMLNLKVPQAAAAAAAGSNGRGRGGHAE